MALGRKLAATVAAALLALALSGCSSPEAEVTDEAQAGAGRFVAERYLGMYVVTDTETGVQYLYAKYGYGGGLTVLVDADGKPIVKEGR